jgi:Holliday junction resolvasome RuvABC endonuclease subunit
MVSRLLPACGKVSEDEADALAVAICHAHYGSWNSKIRKAAAL